MHLICKQMSGGSRNPHFPMGRKIPGGGPGIPGGGLIRARPMRAQGGPQGPGPQGPRGPTRAQGAHKGPGAHEGPGGPTRARPLRAQGSP